MRIGFLSNQMDLRGTGNATFDYADFNERILKNQSVIFTFAAANHNPRSVARFTSRFRDIRYIRSADDVSEVDILYHIKFGNDDGFRCRSGIRYVVHSVFAFEPHGDRYAAVSHWLASRGGRPENFVPHIVELPWSPESYRAQLGISNTDVVIGRYGATDTFDIPFVWTSISDSLRSFSDLHFIFMNTDKGLEHPRIHYLPEGGPMEKKLFINTTDAMLHARARGETFGISVGEFAINGKPIITYADSPERAHLEELGKKALLYTDDKSLSNQIAKIYTKQVEPRFAYTDYTPNRVMNKFKEQFLDY